MYLLMELCKYGQIQKNAEGWETSDVIAERNQEIFEVAKNKG